jgi:para-nitrobenzyl esterase
MHSPSFIVHRPRLLSLLAAIALLATVGAVTLARAAAPAGAASAQVACTPGTTVSTNTGPVCGLVQSGVTSYLGIPYAAPPVGSLRWEPPHPHAPWTATFSATEPGAECPQAGVTGTSENCLNLSVYAPANSSGARLPVIVDIHFGGFIEGGSLDGSLLAGGGHTVVVSMNYRLGILGFLASKSLGAHSGDYGLQDQYAALRWVRNNIAAFGGNPRNVTIEGSSAGGASVCDAMVSPTARGLFQRGISESGFYNFNVNTIWWPADCKSALETEAQAQKAGAAFASKVGCGNAANVAACLRAVPVNTLLADAGQIFSPFSGGAIGPIINGTTLTISPGKAFATGRFDRHASLIIGVARDEFNGGEYTSQVVATTAAQYRAKVKQQFGAMASKVMALYPLQRFPDSSPFIAYRTIMADAFSVCPAMVADRELSRYIPVYAYEFDDANSLHPTDGFPLGSPHSAQAIYLYPAAYEPPAVQYDPDQAPFRDQLVAEWAGFARTGSPTVPGTPYWARFRRGSQLVMSLVPAGDSALTPTSTLAMQHNCGFWDRVR